MQKKQLVRLSGLAGLFFLLALMVLSSKSANADLLNMKLSDPLQPNSNIKELKISPDGQYALFLADDITENAFELYSVPINGQEEPTLLSGGLLPTNSAVKNYIISPDSSRVVYTADQDIAGLKELYSVAISGGQITKLNPPLSWAGNGVQVGSAKFSPDGSRVVFAAELVNPGILELISVPSGGGTSIRLNGDFVLNGNLYDFDITPNGSHVVYLAAQDTAFISEVYIVPLVGGANRKLNDTLPAQGYVQMFKISPDSSRIVYTASQDNAGTWEIYSVSLTDTNATPIKLNPPFGPNRDVVFNKFEISPDGNKVVYMADQVLNDINYFFSVPITGGASTQLTDLSTGTLQTIIAPYFEISSDSNWLVFRSKLGNKTEVYSVTLAGGAVTKLNGPIIPDNGSVVNFQISPNSSRVVFLAHQQTTNSQELFSAPIAGGVVDKLNSALPSSGNVVRFQISEDNQRVVYSADQQVFGVNELFSVPLADGEITKLNPPLVAGGYVGYFQISPNSNHVIYTAVQETAGLRELFVTFEESLPPVLSYKAYMPFVQR